MNATPDASLGTLDLDEGMIGLIKPELAPGERLLWASRSGVKARDVLRSAGTFAAWAFGLLSLWGLCFFALTFSFERARGWGVDGILLVVGLVVGVFGLMATLATLIRLIAQHAAWRRVSREVYALTDRRAILWSPGDRAGGIEIVIMPRGTIDIDGIRRVQFPDGSGDLHLKRAGGPEANGMQVGGIHPRSSFMGIPDVRRVEDLLRSHLIATGTADPMGY